jgi:hypothetical protein
MSLLLLLSKPSKSIQSNGLLIKQMYSEIRKLNCIHPYHKCRKYVDITTPENMDLYKNFNPNQIIQIMSFEALLVRWLNLVINV